jgi:hypothetical protein
MNGDLVIEVEDDGAGRPGTPAAGLQRRSGIRGMTSAPRRRAGS